MRITDVQAYVLTLPRKQEGRPAPWVWGAFSQVLVVVDTDEGLTGYGEAFGYGVPQAVAAVVNQTLRPLLLGAEATAIAALHDRLYRQTHLYGRYGITTFAISGVDIALWDLAGKCAGLPLYRLLGGAPREGVPAYASLVRYDDPQQVHEVAQEAKAEGYKAVKLHQRDVASVRAARDAVGDEVALMLDVNCAWSPAEALAMARRLAPYDLLWLEEPLWPPEDFARLAWLAHHGGLALASGENLCTAFQFRQLLDAGAVTYLQPSVTKVGGISEWRKVAALAEAYNVTVVPHSPYFGPGLLATAHLVAATPHATWLEYLYVPLEASLFTPPYRLEDGVFALPQGPGLGLELDPEVLARYRTE